MATNMNFVLLISSIHKRLQPNLSIKIFSVFQVDDKVEAVHENNSSDISSSEKIGMLSSEGNLSTGMLQHLFLLACFNLG